MKRRDFIVLVGAAAAARPFGSHAQQNAVGAPIAKIGILWAAGTPEGSPVKDVLLEALSRLGYVDGKTAQLVQRSPDSLSDLARLADELFDNRVDVIISVSASGALAAKQLTKNVPIVFVYSADPVGIGLVESLTRPGGNVTGLSLMGGDLVAKRLAFLREAVPTLSSVAFIFDPAVRSTELPAQQDAAKSLGLQLLPVSTPTADDIDRAFAKFSGDGTDGVTVGTYPLMTQESARIAAAALAHRIPTVGYHPGMARDGLLMSYGQDFDEYLRKAAVYADKILKGAKPADLPIEQPTVLKLTVNLKTAKVLGLTIPAPLLVAADEVIE
jgi:putative ABC transport system substrate-binding protein